MKVKNRLTMFILKSLPQVKERLILNGPFFNEHRLLVLSLSSVNFTENLFRGFFSKYDLPDDLFAIYTAIENIEKMLVIMREIDSSTNSYIIDKWEVAIAIIKLDFIRENNNALIDVLRADQESEIEDLEGHLTSNPLYGLIRAGCYYKDNLNKNFHLKVHMHMAWPILKKRGVPHKSLIRLALNVRKMGKAVCGELLSKFPSVSCSQLDYKSKLIKIRENNKPAVICKGFLDEIIYRLNIEDRTKSVISRATKNKYGHHNGGGEIQGVLPYRMDVCSEELLQIDNQEIDEVTYLKYRHAGNDDVDDFNCSNEVAILKANYNKFKNLDPRKIALQLKGEQYSIYKYQQMLPTDNSKLSVFEISVFIREITSNITRQNNANHKDLELILVVAIMFFYGRTLDDVISMRVYANTPEKIESKTNIAYCVNEQIFLSRPLLPPSNSQISNKEDVIPTEGLLKLGGSVFICALIDSLTPISNKIKKTGRELFDVKRESANKNIKTFLNLINKKNNTSLTIDKLYKNIFQEISSKSGDIVDAGLITGQNDSRSASQLYYTTRCCSSLMLMHADTVEDMIVDAGEEFDVMFDKWSIMKFEYATGFVGSIYTPKQITVKKFTSDIISKIKSFECRRGKWFVEYHNIFTAYVISMLDYSTGHRSVEDKYFYYGDVNLEEGYITVNEKDGDDPYNDRVISLTPVCCEQLNKYDTYLSMMIEKLAGISEHKIKTNSTLKSRKEAKNVKSSSIGYFFFLDENLQPTNITPPSLKEIIGDIYSLKLNANRHYYRYNLRNNKCSGEKIDTVVGHWLSGQNPNNRFSTSVLDNTLNSIRDIVSVKMKEDGWIVYEAPLNVVL